tara:strand:+ start:165 stop:524 length:360 start_codon:yes stop_codon:yes gene_type:complete
MEPSTARRVLGLASTASAAELKEAYHRAAFEWHPDRHATAAAKSHAESEFKLRTAAYHALRGASAGSPRGEVVYRSAREMGLNLGVRFFVMSLLIGTALRERWRLSQEQQERRRRRGTG